MLGRISSPEMSCAETLQRWREFFQRPCHCHMQGFHFCTCAGTALSLLVDPFTFRLGKSLTQSLLVLILAYSVIFIIVHSVVDVGLEPEFAGSDRLRFLSNSVDIGRDVFVVGEGSDKVCHGNHIALL